MYCTCEVPDLDEYGFCSKCERYIDDSMIEITGFWKYDKMQLWRQLHYQKSWWWILFYLWILWKT